MPWVHVKKGCLSGIEPGRGTNRNENLHKKLCLVQNMGWNLHMHNHNEKMAANTENRMEYPIEHYYDTLSSNSSPEKFGLKFDQTKPQHLAALLIEKTS